MGTQDTFYLEGATELLQKDLKALGSDVLVELLPGDHGTVLTGVLLNRINKQMADAWRAK